MPSEPILIITQKNSIVRDVPAIFLKMLLGDMSVVVLEGSCVSNSKLKKLGFQFKFEKLEDALKNLIE